MDSNEKSLVKFCFINWVRSGGKDVEAWERIQTSYNVHPEETGSIMLDVIEYFFEEGQHRIRTLIKSLHKLSE